MFSTTNSKKYHEYRPRKSDDIFHLKDYVILDVETTGLSYKTEKIIEIALAKITNGEPADTYTSLVNPGKNLSSRIVSLTGLTDAMLEDAPAFPEIAKDVERFIGKSVILAYNAPFDLSFLTTAFSECGIKTTFQYLDTVKIAKMAYPGLVNYKLETLIVELGLAEKQAHRAMDDVQCTLKLYQLACERMGNPQVRAAITCCHPIEDYQLTYKKAPLKGLRFALIGIFTFPHSNAKALIKESGGTVVGLGDPNIDYLVYGYTEPTDIPSEYEELIKNAIEARKDGIRPELIPENKGSGEQPIPINEVDLLRFCGLELY